MYRSSSFLCSRFAPDARVYPGGNGITGGPAPPILAYPPHSSQGVASEIVSERIKELQETRDTLDTTLRDPGESTGDREVEELIRRLETLPDLTKSLRNATREVKRQVYQAFDLQTTFDKREGRVEISATVAEEVAKALKDSEELPATNQLVTA